MNGEAILAICAPVEVLTRDCDVNVMCYITQTATVRVTVSCHYVGTKVKAHFTSVRASRDSDCDV